MRFLILVCFVCCMFPASAGAAFQVLSDETGQPVEPYQTWAKESKVALPDDYVAVSSDESLCWGESHGRGGCQNGNIIMLSDALPEEYRRAAFYHELGHYIDAQYFAHRQNRRYCRITGLPCTHWTGGDTANPGTGEYFADFFRFAAQYGTWAAYSTATDTQPEFTYGRLPREQTWRSIVSVIDSAVAPKKKPPRR